MVSGGLFGPLLQFDARPLAKRLQSIKKNANIVREGIKNSVSDDLAIRLDGGITCRAECNHRTSERVDV